MLSATVPPHVANYAWVCCFSSLSHVQLSVTPWSGAASPSMGFSRQEYWTGLPLPSPHYILPKYKKNVGTFILNLNYVLMEMFDFD